MINNKEINKLINSNSDHCLSIYIPTFRTGNVQEDYLRFKNALSEGLEHLQTHGFEKQDAHKFLAKGYELLDKDDFWLRQSDGLAVFISEGYFEYYRLPIHFEQGVYTSTQFYIRPLMPMFTENGRFFPVTHRFNGSLSGISRCFSLCFYGFCLFFCGCSFLCFSLHDYYAEFK